MEPTITTETVRMTELGFYNSILSHFYCGSFFHSRGKPIMRTLTLGVFLKECLEVCRKCVAGINGIESIGDAKSPVTQAFLTAERHRGLFASEYQSKRDFASQR